ncbi:MAG: family 1 glycosylhydrolase [Acidimicrobiaceae bacterium]|nr:family 1 glycosylhydrolase [Acidimicrobiaceae bacterium]
MPEPVKFPPGFLWGASTASYQIEGSVHADGRGPSIWDTFSHRPNTTHNGDTGDIACDHYRRAPEDLDLLRTLGAGAYRFSVAWPRIQPSGKGPANEAGLDFYRALVDGLLERGIKPALTLYHWDLPQPLEDAGGWVVRETAEHFAEYASIVADALGDRVDLWTTINEPWCSAWLGYGSGTHAPGRHDLGAAAAANHHLLLGHGLAVDALRAAAPGIQIGISLNDAPVWPASYHPDDVAAAHRVDGNRNRLFIGPLFAGGYPDDMLEHYGRRQPGFSVVRPGDMEAIGRTMDFVSVNFYQPEVVAAAHRKAETLAAGWCIVGSDGNLVNEDLGAITVSRHGAGRTDMGWPIEPRGLTELLVSMHTACGGIPLYVTENGAAFADYVGPDGAVHDPERIAYLDAHVRAAYDAIQQGVDLRGYFVWSLLDNFEWAHGYHARFGLVWVDYPTGTRIPKDSFRWFQGVAAGNGLPAGH